MPVNLSILTRWQIIDNLRRSLFSPAILCDYCLRSPFFRVLHFDGYLRIFNMSLPVLRQCNPSGVFNIQRTCSYSWTGISNLRHPTLSICLLWMPLLERCIVCVLKTTFARMGYFGGGGTEYQKSETTSIGMYSGYILITDFICHVTLSKCESPNSRYCTWCSLGGRPICSQLAKQTC